MKLEKVSYINNQIPRITPYNFRKNKSKKNKNKNYAIYLNPNNPMNSKRKKAYLQYFNKKNSLSGSPLQKANQNSNILCSILLALLVDETGFARYT